MSTAQRTLDFATGLEKARYVDFMGRLEAHCAPVRELVQRAGWLSWPPDARATAIHAYCRDALGYVRDPGQREQLADAGAILERGFEDCDGKARLFVALCTAAGLEARVRPVFDRYGDFIHVQAEVQWPKSAAHHGADADGWVPAELTLRGVPLGSGAEAARRDAAGRVLYA